MWIHVLHFPSPFPVTAQPFDMRTSLHANLTAWTRHHLRAYAILPCHCFINLFGSTGISTCCPSSTPFGLDLGPDLPWADEPSPGNLRLSTGEFLAPLSLLMPAFSLPYSPLLLPVQLLPVYIAPLPIHFVYSQASVTGLSPVNFRRKITRPVSYYALF